jgi:hypothetical protein
VTTATEVHTKVADDLAETVTTDGTVHFTETTKSKREASNVDDYTKTVKSGEENDENRASKIRRASASRRRSRRFRGSTRSRAWVGDTPGQRVAARNRAVDRRSVRGGRQGQLRGHKDADLKVHNVQDTKRKLTEDDTSKTKDDWEWQLKDVTTIPKHYKSLTRKDSTGTTDKTQSEDYSRTGVKDATEVRNGTRQPSTRARLRPATSRRRGSTRSP